MSDRDAHTVALDAGANAYVRLEEARLRCEEFTALAVTDREGSSLRQIHRELGMAGWLVSAEIDADQRLSLLATARRRSRVRVWDVDATDALATAAILAEDAIAEGLAEAHFDHLYLAHLYVLHAEELLHDHFSSQAA